MDTNETGREPTDAELICNYAEAAERRRAAFCVATRREHDVAVESLLDRAEKYLSGQRPMSDTPAPDEVAQLRAEVERLKGWLAETESDNESWVLRDTALSARVAELEAANKSLKAELASLRIHTTPPWEPMFPGKEPTDAEE